MEVLLVEEKAKIRFTDIQFSERLPDTFYARIDTIQMTLR